MYPLGDRVVDLPLPDVFIFPGGAVQLVHLRGGRATDQEHAPLLVGDVSYDEPVKAEHGRLVLILNSQRERVGGGRNQRRGRRKGGERENKKAEVSKPLSFNI